jgi:WD40 repeat protein
MLGTILSIVGGISGAINIYKFGSTLAKGDDTELVLGALDRIHAQVERLNDNILYAPGIEGLSPMAGTAHRLNDLREARALLEPLQAALGGEIVSSGLIETPHKMERAMIENPWAVLEDVRPQHLAVRQANPDKVPVLFLHQGVRYIGWQMRGAMPVLFNCELRDLPGLGASLIPEVPDQPRVPLILTNRPGPSPHAPEQAKNTAEETRTVQVAPEAENSAQAGHTGAKAGIGDRFTLRSLFKGLGIGATRTFAGHTGPVNSVVISPDGRSALSGSDDGTLKLWDLAAGKELRSFAGHMHRVNSVAISPDGRSALSGSGDGTLKLWDLTPGRDLRTFRGHTDAVNSVAISPDGRTALSGGFDKTLKLWDLASGEELRTFKLATGNLGTGKETLGTLYRFTSERLHTFFRGHTVHALAFSPDGRTAVSGGSDETMKLWDIASGRELRSFTGHTSTVTSLAISHDGHFVLSGSWDKTMRLWDIASGRELRSFTDDTKIISSVAISPGGRTALSGGEGRLKLWDLAAGKELRTFLGHKQTVNSIAISPDGRTALSAGFDKTLKLWDLTPYLPAGR